MIRLFLQKASAFLAFTLINCTKFLSFQVLKGLLPNELFFGIGYQHSSAKF